jgi:hypothetical protein
MSSLHDSSLFATILVFGGDVINRLFFVCELWETRNPIFEFWPSSDYEMLEKDEKPDGAFLHTPIKRSILV